MVARPVPTSCDHDYRHVLVDHTLTVANAVARRYQVHALSSLLVGGGHVRPGEMRRAIEFLPVTAFSTKTYCRLLVLCFLS